MRPSYLYYVLPFLPVVWSSITVYHQQPFGATTTTSASGSAAAASYTGAAAYDPTILNAPPIPDPRPPTTFFQQLSSSPVPGLSIPQSGYFLGFSVEFSVINQVCELIFASMHEHPLMCRNPSGNQQVLGFLFSIARQLTSA